MQLQIVIKLGWVGWVGEITYKEKKLFTSLYKAIVKPHLEYCMHVWGPYRKKDIDTLERIQRATKLIPDLRYVSYEEQLE